MIVECSSETERWVIIGATSIWHDQHEWRGVFFGRLPPDTGSRRECPVGRKNFRTHLKSGQKFRRCLQSSSSLRMSRKDFQCVFCLFLLMGDQCSWPEAAKLPAEVTESDTEVAAGSESLPNTHYHRLPNHLPPPPPPTDFYPYPQRPYYRPAEDDTLHEMKETVATFSSMQKQFMNTLRDLQDAQNSPPVMEASGNPEDEKHLRIAKDTQVGGIRDVIGKMGKRKKTRPQSTTTTVVQTVPQPVQTPVQSINLSPGTRLRTFFDRTLPVSHAERTFATIRSDMIDALWTGLTVAVVKLAPLILACIRLVFKAILPLVGMTLLNRSADVPVQAVPVQAMPSTVQFMPMMPVVQDTTTTTVQQDVELDEDALLDDEFEMIKRNFYR
ncbi:uncharacterized protein LOC132256752 [Phlebotomus argentipes]|uniref:uncharacterized protein LOC132256752 n=1 Tax=Phlebotomus argentipes TaxID=94469 RepID=UPI0028937402|nr:uncharacterized protein LOC132256752 [Phlebotomus argentipes]